MNAYLIDFMSHESLQVIENLRNNLKLGQVNNVEQFARFKAEMKQYYADMTVAPMALCDLMPILKEAKQFESICNEFNEKFAQYTINYTKAVVELKQIIEKL